MTRTATTMRDRYGFPIRTCSRCGGTKRYASGWCHKCRGTGVVHPRGRVAQAFTEFAEASDLARRCTVVDLRPGDEITFDTSNARPVPGAAWATVERVTVTPVIEGWMTVGVGENAVRIDRHRYVIYFTDGSWRETSETVMLARRGVTVDPAPYLARAFGRG